jgi:peptidoglycan L-alanyl-D-glutamate endopeptidase CwlK
VSRALHDLSDTFRPLACELLARCVEAKIPVMIIDTLRTEAEQADNIAKGVSWTTRSKHLTGDAIDIAPYAVFDIGGRNELQWDSDADVWTQIGAIGESVGLRWGGRWEQRDLGHFEVKA